MRQWQETNLSHIEMIVVAVVRNVLWMVSLLSLNAEVLMWSSHSQDLHYIWYPAAAHIQVFRVQDHISQCISTKEFSNNLHKVKNISLFVFLTVIIFVTFPCLWNHSFVGYVFPYYHSYFESGKLAVWLERASVSEESNT